MIQGRKVYPISLNFFESFYRMVGIQIVENGDMNRDPKQPTLVSDMLADFFVSTPFIESDQGFLLKLWKKWDHFTKEESMKDSKPVAYHKGRLLLWVSDSVQLQEMNFYMEELKKDIALFFKKRVGQRNLFHSQS